MTPQEQVKRKRNRIKLQKEWYKKLKEDGFSDIETFGRDMEPHHDLKRGDKTNVLTSVNERPSSTATISYYTTLEYYASARDLLLLDETIKVFRIPPDRDVWELHCEGLDDQGIATELGMNKMTVGRKITTYRTKITKK